MPELQTGTTEQSNHHAELQALRRNLEELSRRMGLVESSMISKPTTPSQIMQASGSSKNHSGLPEYDRSTSRSSSAGTTRTYGSPGGKDNGYQQAGVRVHGVTGAPMMYRWPSLETVIDGNIEHPASRGTEELEESPPSHPAWPAGPSISEESLRPDGRSLGEKLVRERGVEEDERRLAEYLPESVYVWACGEKLDPADEDVAATDITIGWLTLVAQLISYIVLIKYAKINEKATYSIYSVFLAMFLMVSISAPDVMTGYSLVIWSRSRVRQAFGTLLLLGSVLLVVASLSVLFMDAANNAELVIGATTVLFVEDVDNRLMSFMLKIPQRWRLFWVLEALGISFWLSFAGIKYLGNPEYVYSLKERYPSGLRAILLWHHVWVRIPGAVTMWALAINSSVIRLSEACRVAKIEREAKVPSRSLGWCAIDVLRHLIGEEMSFAVAVSIWITASVLFNWEFTWLSPVGQLPATDLLVGYASVVFYCFAAGLAGAVVRACCCASRATRNLWYPLFVGWGLGSLIAGGPIYCDFLLKSSCPQVFVWGSELVVFSLGIFLFADISILGVSIARCMKKPFELLRRKDGFFHWTVVCSVQFLMVYCWGRLIVLIWCVFV